MINDAVNNTPDAPAVQDKVEINPTQTQTDTKPDVTPAATTEALENPDWRAFREARKKDRAEREAAEKRASEAAEKAEAMKAAMEALLSRQAPTQQQANTGWGQEEETEEQRISKLVDMRLAAKEQEYARQREDEERKHYPQRLQQNFPDLNQVLSQENLDYLDYHYPEVSRPLQRLQEGYDKWSDIYAAVKKFVPNQANAKRDVAKAESNFQKPKSMSAVGMSQPESQPGSHILTEEKRQANWARMQKLLKGVG